MQATEAPETSGISCQECSTTNRAGSRFCKDCGASIRAPTTCPKCAAAVAAEAKFCADCGTKLVGARADAAAPSPAPAVAQALAAEAATVPAKGKPSSNITANLAIFVAALSLILVAIYAMNKDAKKEVSPFQGGPGPGAAAAEGGADGASAGATDDIPSGDPIKGSITLADGLTAQSGGTLFIVLRNAGMPNRGPPLAVRKIDNPSFPAEFTVSASDVMMKGMPFMGPFDIYVRMDGDGNAMSKGAGDLVNASPKAGIKAGQTGVAIALDKRL